MSVLNLFAEFATDSTAEKEGVWVEYGDNKFLIAMSGNRKYRERFIKLYKPHERLFKTNSEAAEAKSNELLADVMAHTILLNWTGEMVVEKDGQPVKYSVENAKKALSLPRFRDLIQGYADDFSLFKAVKEEEEEKN